MHLIIAIPLFLLIIWVMLRNAKQQQEYTHQEWLECANGMFTFHKTQDVSLYTRVLRLHRTRQLKPSFDRIARLWIRRVLEAKPGYHTGTLEENAIQKSEMLFSYLAPVVSLFQNGNASSLEVLEAINESAVQYGASGDKRYLLELQQAGPALGGMYHQQCMVHIARLMQ